MKKNLLFAAAFLAAMTATAQTETGFLDATALDLASKPVLPAGTVLAETPNVTLYLGNEQEVNAQQPDFAGMKQIIVNGETIDLVTGIGGKDNPSAVNVFGQPSQGGMQYHLTVKKDGWIIMPSKISSNKNFYAYEGSFDGEMMLLAFTLGMDIQNEAYPDIKSIVYTLPADDDGYCNLESPEMDKYLLGGTAIAWPIRIATGNAEAATAGNGTGVMMFPVYADAVDYWVFATGSKMNTCGFIFVPSDPAGAAPAVTIYGAEKSVAVTGELQTPGAGDTNGIENIVADELNENAPIYNVMGQRVNKDYKGVLIQNGKKFMNF